MHTWCIQDAKHLKYIQVAFNIQIKVSYWHKKVIKLQALIQTIISTYMWTLQIVDFRVKKYSIDCFLCLFLFFTAHWNHIKPMIVIYILKKWIKMSKKIIEN